MNKKCWDCLHFITQNFSRVDDALKDNFISSTGRLSQALAKAKKQKSDATYWRCKLGKHKTEYCTMEQTARKYVACDSFSSMDDW